MISPTYDMNHLTTNDILKNNYDLSHISIIGVLKYLLTGGIIAYYLLIVFISVIKKEEVCIIDCIIPGVIFGTAIYIISRLIAGSILVELGLVYLPAIIVISRLYSLSSVEKILNSNMIYNKSSKLLCTILIISVICLTSGQYIINYDVNIHDESRYTPLAINEHHHSNSKWIADTINSDKQVYSEILTSGITLLHLSIYKNDDDYGKLREMVYHYLTPSNIVDLCNGKEINKDYIIINNHLSTLHVGVHWEEAAPWKKYEKYIDSNKYINRIYSSKALHVDSITHNVAN